MFGSGLRIDLSQVDLMNFRVEFVRPAVFEGASDEVARGRPAGTE